MTAPADGFANFTFGQRIINPHASEDNPHKRGSFVRMIHIPRGRCNSGYWYECTNGQGDFWRSKEIIIDPNFTPPGERAESK